MTKQKPTAADVKQRWFERGDNVGPGPIMTQGKGFYWAHLDGEAFWPHDYECAFECFQAAAERGSIEAKHYLSICFSAGQGTEADVKKAFQLCLEAAESDLPGDDAYESGGVERARARRRLGMMFWCGVGTEPDSKKGRYWYEQARLPDDHRLNKMIETDMAVRLYEDEEYSAAAALLKQALAKSSLYGGIMVPNAVASWHLGYMLYNGLGIEKNDQEAFDCFKGGARDVLFPHDLWEIHPRRIALCQYGVGCCFDEGRGTSRSPEEAVAWYRMAATSGVGEAYQALGVCYVLGQGVPKNRSEARQCFQQAIENGCEEACDDLARLDREDARPSGGFWPHV